MLIDECHKTENGDRVKKTKTSSIICELEKTSYERKNLNPVIKLNRKEAKHIIQARYGMLECAKNFKIKYGKLECPECNTPDNENHRLNQCKKLANRNWLNKQEKVNFDQVYSDDVETLRKISANIQKVWDESYSLDSNKTNMTPP